MVYSFRHVLKRFEDGPYPSKKIIADLICAGLVNNNE